MARRGAPRRAMTTQPRGVPVGSKLSLAAGSLRRLDPFRNMKCQGQPLVRRRRALNTPARVRKPGWKQVESGADRGGLCLGDDEHAGSMGARTEGGKLAITVFRSALVNAICWAQGARTRFKVVFAGSTS